MEYRQQLYPDFQNPLLYHPERPLPQEVAVIGAGTIGPDIGYYLKSAIPDMRLILIDVVEKPLRKAEERFRGYTEKAVQKGKMDPKKAEKTLQRIDYTTDYSAISKCELVIEAATEDLNLKKKIFAMVEGEVGTDTTITSNTSSIPADRIFSDLRDPSRATITHFFGPAWRNPLVEVVTWKKVKRSVVDYLCWLFCKTGKTPIVSGNAIQFILNRVFNNWANEAVLLVENGIANAAEVDCVAEDIAATGPIFVLNITGGNRITEECNKLLMEEGDHYRPAKMLCSVESWHTKPRGMPMVISEDVRRRVRDRLLGAVFSQCFDIINRGIGTPEDLNLGCQMGLAFKKGPFDTMRELGEIETSRIIRKLQAERPGFPGPLKDVSYYQNFKRHIITDVIDGAKIITMRRPQFLNAVNDEVTNEILAAIEEDVDNPHIKGFVLTGYGERAFCAGAEIGRFPEVLGNHDAAVEYTRECAQLLSYVDMMKKPLVAAVNGMALGGGFELALRCHSIVAKNNAYFQFPEITLGIIPGLGGCIVPYRRWPEASRLFHDMIRCAKPLTVQEAKQIGMVKDIAEDYCGMIRLAVAEVSRLQGNVEGIADGKVSIDEIEPTENLMAGDLPLSKEAVSIAEKTIKRGAAASTFQAAMEFGYQGFGEAACTTAAREGISAFQEKRRPNFVQ